MVFHVAGAAYDDFMGRYSRRLAPLFLDFAAVGPGRVLDVGAGTGALTATLAERLGADRVAAAEPSEELGAALDRRFPAVETRRAPAEELPWEDGTFAAALAQLVVSFVADASATVAEMRRVVRPGGAVALCMWEEDGLELSRPLRAARDVAVAPDAPPPSPLPFRSAEALAGLLAGGGLGDVRTATLEVSSEYESFEEFWAIAAAMTGPDTAWMHDVDDERLEAGREAARRSLGSPEGPFVLHARAVAARGIV